MICKQMLVIALAICYPRHGAMAGAHTGDSEYLFPGMLRKETEQLADGVYAFRYTFYRNVFIVGEDGVIATDPMNDKAARALRAAIAEVTDLPVRWVAYSHSHWDHSSGGQLFKDEGAQFVAQKVAPRTTSRTRTRRSCRRTSRSMTITRSTWARPRRHAFARNVLLRTVA